MYSSKVGEVTKEIQFLCHNSKTRLLWGRREGEGRREGGGRGKEGGRREKGKGKEGGRERLLLGLNVSLLPIPAAVLVQF